jgi:hypothetical protein
VGQGAELQGVAGGGTHAQSALETVRERGRERKNKGSHDGPAPRWQLYGNFSKRDGQRLKKLGKHLLPVLFFFCVGRGPAFGKAYRTANPFVSFVLLFSVKSS